MKSRFNTIDIAVIVQELKRFLSMRVVNVYDIDNKTYLLRVGKPDEKDVILIESGIRLHSTEFDWPKNPAPSGFSMKMRKHLKGRRFESIRQLGIDRVVDLQFGSGEAAYHVIVELYDRGNIVLTDHEFTILNILRPRTDNSQDVRFAVRETYPTDTSKVHQAPTEERLRELLQGAKQGDVLKKVLVPHLDYGPAIIDHVLLGAGFVENVKKGNGFNMETDFPKLMTAIYEAESMLQDFMAKPSKGYIIQKKDKKPAGPSGEQAEDILLYDEFHPFQFRQHDGKPSTEFIRFDRAVDEFFSKLESQKLDMKVIQQEKSAMKKLENVKKDHEKRIHGLQKEQESDILRGQLIEMNLELVDQAILIVRSALANQIDWTEIWNLVKEAQVNGDPVANCIKALKLESNQITLLLSDPYVAPEGEESDVAPLKPMRVDIDLAISAYGNSRRYFDKKKQAAKKEQKTVEASNKAFKSAEKKTKQTLKDVATAVSINKTRKTYWFEKFLWFISSENYLVIGGRDQQQNELIVKRYMNQGDLYVHADLHGASSCVVKNPTGLPVPPKTLNEAGTMAICNSAAWDSKVVTSAWWVHHDQVSKTAPSGEYLTTGSFMIRGRKNFLPPSYLVYGFGFVFKLEEGSVERHLEERKIRTTDDDASSVADSLALSSLQEEEEEDTAIDISDDDDDDDDNNDDDNVEGKDEKKEGLKPVDEVLPESQSVSKNAGDNETDDVKMERKEREKEKGKGKEKTQQSTSEEDILESAFPDTVITLQHVKGDKYELHRELSTGSTASSQAENTIHFGDGVPVTLGEKTSAKTAKLSAKQRREMKKGKKGSQTDGAKLDEEDKVSWLHPQNQNGEKEDEEEEEEARNEPKEKTTTPGAPPPKRGQRAKLKKMKEKYADQDEEERRLRMEILASSGPQKEEKKKKGKKGKDHQSGVKGQRPNSAPQQGKPQGPKPAQGQTTEKPGEATQSTVVAGAEGVAPQEEKKSVPAKPKETQEVESDGEKEEETAVQDDMAVINSLTGQPVGEDELLYAIPVCAPYNAILNYKYKVKLMPGSTKRGKAVKTALNVFVHEKTASGRERDLLKIQKDVDLSRNVPGKVKVAAPNLHKSRR